MAAPPDLEELRRAQDAVAGGRWAEAVTHARVILDGAAPDADAFFGALQLGCWAQFNVGGRDAARALYARHAAAMWRMLAQESATPAWLRGALDAAVLVEDFTTIRALFHKVFRPPWNGIDLAVAPHMAIAEWSRSAQTPVREIEASHIEADANGRWHYTTDAVQSAWIAHGEVLLGWDYVVTSSGTVLRDSGHYPLAMIHGAFPHYLGVDRVVHPWQPAATAIDADVLVMTAPPDLFIGHWIIDFLPRLRALPADSDIKIVIPADLPAKLRDLLPAFGIEPARVMELPRGRRYRFRRVLAVHTGDPHKPSAATVQFVGQALRRPGVLRECLLLRRDTTSRSIVNRAEVDAVLSRHGFETVALADMPIADQQARLGGAKVVIATYGSDLLANLFMPPGAHLIELNYDPAALDAGAAPRSAFLGVHHHLLTCPRAAQSGVTGHRKDSDFSVDCVALERLLRDILAGS